MKKILLSFILAVTAFVSFTSVFGDSLIGETQFYNITIFIRFADETDYEAPYGLSHYEEMLNGVGTESLRDYYLEVSYGELTIDSYIPTDNGNIIFYTDIYDRNYFEPYGDDNPQGVRENEQAQREHDLIERAMDFVDENNLVPDDMDLDVNDDQMIDSLTFMISGEDTGWNTLLWPHKWELYDSYSEYQGFTPGAPTINGIYGYTYTWELLGNSTSYDYQVDVGVLAHETFHLLGAPDLYHYYSYWEVEPVGSWGLMEYNGVIPSHMLGYMKEEYGGWIDATTEITESGSYTLYPMQDSPNNIYKIYTGETNEWIYLEYRDSDGKYESNLPDTGLLVYRVNQNVNGNESGSYGEDGTPLDEVFVYRPFMDDVIEPIVIVDGDYTIDGDVDEAALSDTNHSDEIGLGSSIPLWSSDGSILNIGIFNVVEHDGYVTFDVFLEPQIELESDFDLRGKDVVLYDNEMMVYDVVISNVPEGLELYYTLDGTTPTKDDLLYDGTSISIDADNHIVSIALYDGNEIITSSSRDFTFKDIMESEHDPYPNMVEEYYYFDFGVERTFTLDFDNRSQTEEDYDYLYLYVNEEENVFHGTNMRDFVGIYTSDQALVVFDTDDYVNEYFGFLIELVPDVEVGIRLLGQSYIEQEALITYNDLGAELYGSAKDNYSIKTIGEVDVNTLGEYVITYQILNDLFEVIEEVSRTVVVKDTIAPTVELVGDSEVFVEAGSTYNDLGIEFSDNFDSNPTIAITGIEDLDTSLLRSTTVTYTVTDSSGNETVVKRIVTIVDTEAPTGTIASGVDTITVGEEWVDMGVDAVDNLSVQFDVVTEGEVDVNTPGTYTITYFVSDASENTQEFVRVVHVLELVGLNEVSVACNSMTTTLTEEEQLVIKPCFINGEIMNVEDAPNELSLGLHEIIYYKEVNDVRYEYKVYYFVYEKGTEITLDMIGGRKEDE